MKDEIWIKFKSTENGKNNETQFSKIKQNEIKIVKIHKVIK